MPDYQQGKIYTIRYRTDDTMIYVGSTIQPLYKRLYKHKNSSKKEPERLIYKTINNDWDNWYIELHSLYPCSCKEELCKREGEVIREIGTLNSYVPCRTGKERYAENYNNKKIKELERGSKYYYENKDIKDEYWKTYRENNKDKIKEKITCECGCIISKNNIGRHRKQKNHLDLIKTTLTESV